MTKKIKLSIVVGVRPNCDLDLIFYLLSQNSLTTKPIDRYMSARAPRNTH